MRSTLALLAMLWLLVASGMAQTPPNVVLIVLDDAASADLALYGGPVSCPNIEGLAAVGVRFDRAYANATCSPTRRCLNFGRWWLTGNGVSCEKLVQPNTPGLLETSIAQAMPGYSSAFFGKWHLGGSKVGDACAPIVHGFTRAVQAHCANVLEGGTSYSNWTRETASMGSGCSSALSTNYEPRALRDAFVAGFPMAPQPNLTVFNSNLAHAPFHVPPADMLPPGYPTPPTQRARFEAMIVAYDQVIGAMLAVIDLETTVVIVIGDNGTPPNVAPNAAKAKGTTFERGVRVPLIVAGGPVLAGIVNAELVHAVDVYATCAALAGNCTPTSSAPLAGVSLVPILTGATHAAPHEMVLIGSRWGSLEEAEAIGTEGVDGSEALDFGDRASVSADGFKLRQIDANLDLVVDSEEFYDLTANPGETVNLIADPAYAAAIAAHRAFLVAETP